MDNSQLLCTFTTVDGLDGAVESIKRSYKLIYNKIYVLENRKDVNQLVLTYNILKEDVLNSPLLESTISVHRKKMTNTIYTINAINKLIALKNDGVMDKTFQINWAELKNCVLVTAHGKLKIVNTELIDIINL
jgi:hypothetical protein